MRVLLLAGGLVSTASYSAAASAAPLVFAGISAHTDIRRTRALSCLNIFGNKEYLCRYPAGNYANIPVLRSYASYNDKTFRPTWVRLNLKPTSPEKLVRALVKEYGLPVGQGELKLKGGSAREAGNYSIWAFDAEATIVVKHVSDNLQLEVSFPENEDGN